MRRNTMVTLKLEKDKKKKCKMGDNAKILDMNAFWSLFH